MTPLLAQDSRTDCFRERAGSALEMTPLPAQDWAHARLVLGA